MPDYIIIIQILIKESMSYIFTRFPKSFSLHSQLFNGFCSKNENNVNQKAWTDHVPRQWKVVSLLTKLQDMQQVPKKFETGRQYK